MSKVERPSRAGKGEERNLFEEPVDLADIGDLDGVK